ncbi:PD40 domain-containing protein [bacterium]|nr:PD40 domain-containing protein [bacterium]
MKKLIILSTAVLVSCSGSKKTDVVGEAAQTATQDTTISQVEIKDYEVPKTDTEAAKPSLDSETAQKLAELENLAKTNPKDSDANLNLGNGYFKGEIWDEALSSYKKVLVQKPDNKEALVRAGQTSMILGQKTEAMNYFRKALEELKDKDTNLINEIASFVDEPYEVTQLTFGNGKNGLAKFSSYEDKIVFQSNRKGNWDIFLADANCQNETNLTEANAVDGKLTDEENPSFNFNSSSVIFTSTANGKGSKESKNRDIYTMNLADFNQNLVIEDASDDWSPTFDENGNIVFTSERDDFRRGKFYTLVSSVYLYNADDQQISRITKDNYDESNAIFVSNSEMIVAANKNGNFDLFRVGTDGTEKARLTESIADDGCPAISGNKQKIAFASEKFGNTEIFVMNSDGSGLQKVTTNPGFDGFPSLNYNGDKLLFTSDRNGDYQIFMVNLGSAKSYTKQDLEAKLQK